MLAGDPDSSASVFAILENGATGTPPAIIADNYEAAISLLNFFASAAIPPEPSEVDIETTQRRGARSFKSYVDSPSQ